MRLQFDAFIIGSKEYGDNAAIISTFSKEYGLKKGIVKNIKNMQSIYQNGNFVSIIWFGREESLGVMSGECIVDYAQRFMSSKYKLLILMSLCGIIESFLHDGDTSHGDVFDASKICFDFLLDNDNALDILMSYLLQEIKIINSLGLSKMNIDLSCIKSMNNAILNEYTNVLNHYNKKLSKYRIILSNEISRISML